MCQGAALVLGPISIWSQYPRQQEARWALGSGCEPQASLDLPLHTQTKNGEVRPRHPAEHSAVSQAPVPGDCSWSLERRLREPALATCLVSSPAACAAAASKFLCFSLESAVWIDLPRAVSLGLRLRGSPSVRVRGAAPAVWSWRAPERSCGGDSPGDPLRCDGAR